MTRKKETMSEYEKRAKSKAVKLYSIAENRQKLVDQVNSGSMQTVSFYGAGKARGFLFNRRAYGDSHQAWFISPESGNRVRVMPIFRRPDDTYYWCTRNSSCVASKEGNSWKVLVYRCDSAGPRELARERFRIYLECWLNLKGTQALLNKAETLFRKQAVRNAERDLKRLRGRVAATVKALSASKKALKEWSNRK